MSDCENDIQKSSALAAKEKIDEVKNLCSEATSILEEVYWMFSGKQICDLEADLSACRTEAKMLREAIASETKIKLQLVQELLKINHFKYMDGQKFFEFCKAYKLIK
jgi:hypothetical protein